MHIKSALSSQVVMLKDFQTGTANTLKDYVFKLEAFVERLRTFI